jgi:hypothetical protein
MNEIDKINTKRMIEHMKTDIGEILATILFEKNTPTTQENVVQLMNAYLRPLQERRTIYDHSVAAYTPTWEQYIPFMPERLLAIEAVEKFGAVLPYTEENIQRVKGYPYRLVEDYYVFVEYDEEYDEEYGVPDGCRDWYGSSDSGPPPEGHYETVCTLQIDDPTDKFIVDLHIQPAAPIECVRLNILLPLGSSDVD